MTDLDEKARQEFESDWLKGSQSDIADYLPRCESPAYLPTLEELICIDLEFRWRQPWRIRTTAEVSQPTSAREPCLLEDYLDRFPKLREPAILQRLIEQEVWVRKRSSSPPTAEEYQRRFPELQLMPSTWRRALGDAPTAPLHSTSGAPVAKRPDGAGPFGPYQLLKILGRGGMGSVYLAHHSPTNREVAIKIAKIEGFSANMQEEIARRFQTEVRAAAQISHANVTPIYDAGEIDGELYYTMPVIAGDLAAETRRQPLTNERAAHVIAQAARGVAAAHACGLLHRDLKPANLLYDVQSDRVLIADFGLARIHAAQEQLTRTNQHLGTPPYMSPEQIRQPKECDARSDIYSLGATLYHLLTGRPPFQASTPVETLRQVAEDDPVSPRLLNPQVDRDLETICMRCLQKEPALRFQTAGELADDLERRQRGEPIRSRPLGFARRLLRWRRRNPVPAALSAALAAALLLAAVTAGIGWRSTNRQLSRVVANNRQGQAALNELFAFVRTEPLFSQPGQELVREKLLERGLEHYTLLLELAEENESLPIDVVAARTARALLALELHGAEPAIAQLEAAISSGKKSPPALQQTAELQEVLGDAYNGLGQARHRLGEYRQAAVAFDQAIALRTKAARHPTAESQRKLANARMNRGLTAAAEGDIVGAKRFQEAAQQMRQTLLAHTDHDARLQRDFAQGQFNLARLELQQGEPGSAEELLGQATLQFESLSQQHPTDAMIWQRYIECLLMQAILDHQHAAPAAPPVSPSLSKAIELLQPLVMLAPHNRTYRLRLIELHQQAIEQLLAGGRGAQAEPVWQVVDARLLARIDSTDQQPDVIRLRLENLRQRGLISLAQGDRTRAKTELMAAVAAWRNATTQSTNEQLKSASSIEEWTTLQQLADSL
ncbi:protein kinase domain-containing protein [Lignipirellula cremea]|uniref:non-specific serine/threonine protein kinase n=1 Tax=Lignipirellula cremea TaxID=2528010 RepID=A0A518DLA9_9BACT|nr:protein kinase [Lignipirellula cremea]QDU92623.1 Serine/threonine-protein kinase PknB [Lignipirellula cremea]